MSQPTSIRRIVVADDHPIFLKGLTDVIRSSYPDAVIDQANDGEEALQLIRILRPHLAILDVEMPGMSGIEAAKRIEEEFPSVKKVILTMHNSPAALDLAMAYNVQGYVLKENAVSDICRCIDEVLFDRHFVSPQMRESMASRKVKDGGLLNLTATERRILSLIANNMTTRGIADLLSVSEKTISNHRMNIANKIGLKGQHMLLRYAIENQSVL